MNPQQPDSFSPHGASGNQPVQTNPLEAPQNFDQPAQPAEAIEQRFDGSPAPTMQPQPPVPMPPRPQPQIFSPQQSPQGAQTFSAPEPPPPASPQVPGIFGAPQPPVQANPGQPSPNDYYANGAKPGNTLGIISLVLAVIVAPAGLVLGIISMIKGFKKQNKTLAMMGLAAVILSPIMMVAGVVLFSQLHNSALDVGSLKEQKLVIGRNTITAQIPDKFKQTNSTAENQEIYSIKGVDKDGKETAAAQFAASIIEDAYSTADLAIIKSALNNPSSQEGKIFSSIVKQSLIDELKQIGCGDTVMENPEPFTIEGAEYGAKFAFHCDIGDEGRYKGYMIDAGTKTDESIILVAAAEEMWTKNVEKFEKTVSSLKLESN